MSRIVFFAIVYLGSALLLKVVIELRKRQVPKKYKKAEEDFKNEFYDVPWELGPSLDVIFAIPILNTAFVLMLAFEIIKTLIIGKKKDEPNGKL